MSEAELRALHRLAAFCGVQRVYRDLSGVRRHASPQALQRVVEALGAAPDPHEGAAGTLARLRRERAERMLEPVVVSFGAQRVQFDVTLPQGAPPELQIRIGGTSVDWTLLRERARQIDGLAHVCRRVELPEPLQPGYHDLEVVAGAQPARSLLIAAPAAAPELAGHGIGLFLPLHALRREQDLGIGDFGGLARLAELAGEGGCTALGTLPLLATNLDEPFEFSPYSPTSRCHWNELFLDVDAIPELAECEPARAALARARASMPPDADPLVDYRDVLQRKRSILAPIAQMLATAPGARGQAFRAFAADPELQAYARFRAIAAARREPFADWPEPLRSGSIPDDAFDPELANYHACVQWLAGEQLRDAQARAARAGVALYLDLPLGVHGSGFDVWRQPELFLRGVSAGAPPDPLFPGGQDWGFPPLHPQRSREQGHAHLRAVLGKHMRHCGLLRIDHVMSLHRLYVVPHGMPATEGVYLRYPTDELYAVLCLEAVRTGCRVVGEDLGTVPMRVRRELERRRISRMYVLQMEADAQQHPVLRAPTASTVASLNTHDMPSWRGFVEGRDITEFHALGLLDETQLAASHAHRAVLVQAIRRHLQQQELLGDTDDPLALLQAALAWLARSGTGLVVVNLEDLWLEPEPQNIPGTWRERPNWRRRARHTLEQIAGGAVGDTLRRLSGLRAARVQA